jgi:hypothetical protein
VIKPDGKRLLGRLRRRLDDIKMDLQEVGCGGTFIYLYSSIHNGT